ncbi:hypothetical protein [Parasitella parasitica]|uniref:Uncharacterized protein n=1 Tax=Parasitella parasitica TaxID=35722 RepID=A0A0B7N3J0_9FUNG|nr:hypothetical protein [Parasitella parasitica]
MSLPEYQGPLIPLGQLCLTAPHPTLRDASHLSKNMSETRLEWPQTNAYDSYYSNCANNLYCDRAHICVKQLAHGEVCESDNQCLHGSCTAHTCVEKAKKNNSQGSNTVHIITSVVGIALLLVAIICVYLFKRRQFLNKRLNQKQDAEKEPAVLPKTTTDAIKSNSSASNTTANSSSTASSATLDSGNQFSIDMLNPAYDSHFQSNNDSRTPTMQQQQLQYQLQRQMLFNNSISRLTQESSDLSSSIIAPPPYSASIAAPYP